MIDKVVSAERVQPIVASTGRTDRRSRLRSRLPRTKLLRRGQEYQQQQDGGNEHERQRLRARKVLRTDQDGGRHVALRSAEAHDATGAEVTAPQDVTDQQVPVDCSTTARGTQGLHVGWDRLRAGAYRQA